MQTHEVTVTVQFSVYKNRPLPSTNFKGNTRNPAYNALREAISQMQVNDCIEMYRRTCNAMTNDFKKLGFKVSQRTIVKDAKNPKNDLIGVWRIA